MSRSGPGEERLQACLAILAGGRSERMGAPKHLIALPEEAGAVTLLQFLLGRFQSAFSEVVIAASPDTLPAELRELARADRLPDRGPLAGIEAALAAATSEVILVLACDLPLAQLATARNLTRLALAHDAAWARHQGRAQPLFGAYRKSTLSRIRAALDEHRLQVGALADVLDVAYVEVGDHELTNVNTPQDLEALKARLRAGGQSASPYRAEA